MPYTYDQQDKVHLNFQFQLSVLYCGPINCLAAQPDRCMFGQQDANKVSNLHLIYQTHQSTVPFHLKKNNSSTSTTMVPSNGSDSCNLTPAGNPLVDMVVIVAAAEMFRCNFCRYCCCYGCSVTNYCYAAWSSASKFYTFYPLKSNFYYKIEV